MTRHEGIVKKWVKERLNISLDMDEEVWVKRIIDEMITNTFEQRYTFYTEVSEEEWKMLF